MFFGMLALVAEFERERIRERVAEGRNAKRAKGGHIGGPPPYGFIVEGSGTQARLVPDPKFADLYDTVRSLRNDNYTLREISEALSRQGYVNRRGRLFDPTQIKRFLSPTPNRSLAV
jgi:site-specific DNA recombinase